MESLINDSMHVCDYLYKVFSFTISPSNRPACRFLTDSSDIKFLVSKFAEPI